MFSKVSKGFLFLSLVSFTIFAFSDNREDYNYPARNIDTDDAGQPKSSRQTIDQMQDRNITPDAGPYVAHGADVFITADFIYWSVREDGLAYAYTGNSPLTFDNIFITSTNASKGSVQHVDFDWEPGFKVGLGMNLNHDGWDIYAEYTWLRSHPSTSSVTRDLSNTANRIIPTWFTGDFGANQIFILGLGLADQTTTFASGQWDFHFNVIDLELGRNFYISKYLTIRPHIGLKGTWQNEDLTVKYRSSLLSPLFGFPFDMTQHLISDLDYWGIGIRTGLDNAWYFMRNFCLFGDLALTALWGKYDLDRKDTQTFHIDLSDPDSPTFTVISQNFENEFHSIKGILELTIGLRYDIWWNDDDYHFGIQAGWEEQIWINHNQFFNATQEASFGDLVLHGLTLKARFDF